MGRLPVIFFSCLLAVWIAAATSAAGAVAAERNTAILLDPWHFGLGKSEALRLPGASAGEGEFAGDVLLPESSFAGLPWTVRLEFREDALVRVILMEVYSKARLDAVSTALREMGFEMLALLAEGTQLDFIATLKTEGTDALRERIDRLSRKPRTGQPEAWAWFDTSRISREMKLMARNVNELLQMVSADTREAEVTLLYDNTGKPAYLLVDFSLPVLERQTFDQERQRAKPE